MLHHLSITLYLVGDLILLSFAAMYLFRRRPMPYHLTAIGKIWPETDPAVRVLFVALMRTVGSGFLSIGITIPLMLFWSADRPGSTNNLILLLMVLTLMIPVIGVGLFVRRYTIARPPVSVSLLGTLIIVAAFVCELWA